MAEKNTRVSRPKPNYPPEVQARRKAAYVFVAVYVTFCLTVIALMAVRSHQLGYGWI